MANYSVGITTKNKIVDVAKELFYTKGYEKTTYADICDKVGIGQGNLHYYFKSKAHLADTVDRAYMDYLNESVYTILQENEITCEPYLLFSVIRLVHWKLFFDDPQYRRYAQEVRGAFNKDLPSGDFLDLYLYNLFLPELDDTIETRLKLAACSAVEDSVSLRQNNVFLALTPEYVFDFVSTCFAKILDADMVQMKHASAKAAALLQQYGVPPASAFFLSPH